MLSPIKIGEAVVCKEVQICLGARNHYGYHPVRNLLFVETLFLVFLDHLPVQGWPLALSSNTFCHVPHLLSTGIYSYCHSISFFVDLCLISQGLLVSEISHRRECHLASKPLQSSDFEERLYRFDVHRLPDVIISNMNEPHFSSCPCISNLCGGEGGSISNRLWITQQ